MNRVVPVLIAASLLLVDRAYAQHAQHDDVEIIDGAAVRSPDEKKPNTDVVIKSIVERTNEFRAKQGRSHLSVNAKLAETAREFAAYMASSGRFGHTADGHQPSDRVAKHGYDYCIVLENIAYAVDFKGFTSEELTSNIVEGWKRSPGHHKNMLDPDVTEIGVGVARGEKTGYYFAVQVFGRPKSLALMFQIENRSATQVSYKIGDRDFVLPSGYTRTHEQCRPTNVDFKLSAEGKPHTIDAMNGSRFVVTEDAGVLRIKQEPAGGR